MKNLLKAPVAALLAHLARAVLRKYRPLVVMVTGSVGKTSTKDAVAATLSKRFYLRASEKSYNSEFGVPLTILGAKNPWTDALAWLGVFREAILLLVAPSHYPKLLVLEVGADRPGDLRQILKIATPDAVIVTRLPDVPVHVEAYASPEAVREEEFSPAYALAAGAPLIISSDDRHAVRLSTPLAAKVWTFGSEADAFVRVASARVMEEGGRLTGMQSELSIGKEQACIRVAGAFGRTQVFAPAAALTLALALGLTKEEALAGLEGYVPPPGRARIVAGKNGSVLIDDSYNASPAAAEEILRSLKDVPNVGRRIAVLGDMLELGRYSKEEHERIGKIASETADIVVSVGNRAQALHAAALIGKGKDEALHFDDSRSAAAALETMVREKDLVLIKGSQGMRMERITSALLFNPIDSNVLPRQDKEWLKKA